MSLLDYIFPVRRNERNFSLSASFLKSEMEKLYERCKEDKNFDWLFDISNSKFYLSTSYEILWKNIPKETLLLLETLLKKGEIPQIKFWQDHTSTPYVQIHVINYERFDPQHDIIGADWTRLDAACGCKLYSELYFSHWFKLNQ